MVASIVAMASTNVLAKSYCYEFNFSPYVGAAAQVANIDLQTRFGKPLYQQHLPMGGIFGGAKINDYFGVEVGFDTSKRKSQTRSIYPGEFLPGAPVPLRTGQMRVFNTKLNMNSSNLGIIGYLPLRSIRLENMEIFGEIGISSVKVKAKQVLVDDEFQGLPDPQAIARSSFTYKKRKAISSLTLGLQNKITNELGWRLFVNWKNLSTFNKLTSRQNPNATAKLKFKNFFAIGAGFYFAF